MPSKNRQKNSEKSSSTAPAAAAAPAASIPDDAPKKSPKTSSTNGVSGPAAQGPRSGGCLGLLVSTLFYVALIGGAGFAAFYAQQVVEEMRQSNAKNEDSARRSAELGSKMESVVEQVATLRSVVDGLESSLGITRVELEGAVARMKRGEVETRKVEEALQKLQNNLVRDLSDGLAEVQESREKDFSSLETTVEERLAEVSQSISATMAIFTEAQGAAQSQMADLKARLGDMEDPALIKRELESIVEAIAEIKTTNEASDSSTEMLTAQISAVRDELQTRNNEVASLSEEVDAVRVIVQTTSGALKQSLSAAENEIQTVRDQAETLGRSVEQVVLSVRDVDQKVDQAAAQAQRRSDDLEVRVKTAEESESTLSDLNAKVELLAAKYNMHQSALVTHGEAVEKVRTVVKEKLEALKTSRGGSDSDSALDQEVAHLKERLAAMEDKAAAGNGGAGMKAEQLKKLQSVVEALQSRAAKHESHEHAIASLQDAVQKTAKTLASMAKQK